MSISREELRRLLELLGSDDELGRLLAERLGLLRALSEIGRLAEELKRLRERVDEHEKRIWELEVVVRDYRV